MLWWSGLLWGMAGAGFIEGLDLLGAIRRVKDYPWRATGEVPIGPYLLSVVIRVGVGAGLAAALASSGQIAGAVGAIAAGVAAPKIIEQLARTNLPSVAAEAVSHSDLHSLPAPMASLPAEAENISAEAAEL